MRFFKFFKAWALTGPLTWISKQRSSVLHANLQLTAVGGQCATGPKKVALRTAKLIVPGLLIVLFMGSLAAPAPEQKRNDRGLVR